ncbi:MAG: iron-sulfur cluster assembly accessory protein [Gammaproteobacteria bacterium]|nr:iron-sulfur cluster assembly accessory protein [Gammaproteobacteria bacterium]
MAITLTDSAAERVRTYLEKRGSGLGLRLGVTQTGCSGYSYVINYAEEIDDFDVVFEDRGVTIVVDPEALQLIDGTEVDFIKNGLNEAFSFRNPNIVGECGCGESFNV